MTDPVPPPQRDTTNLCPERAAAWFWAILEALPGAALVADGHRRLMAWNLEAARRYGYADSLRGLDLLTLAPFEAGSALHALLHERLAAGPSATGSWSTYDDDRQQVELLELSDGPQAAGSLSVPGGGILLLVHQPGDGGKATVARGGTSLSVDRQLLFDAFHDQLTGLPNRALLLDRLEQVLVRRHVEPKRGAAVLFLDFDRFKVVNDSLGHAVGDAMLRAIAEALTGLVRPEDTVARLGGDEFVILMDHVDSGQKAIELATRIQATFNQPLEADGHQIHTSASIGVVPSVVDYDRPDDVLRDADTAMYAAKDAGRARFRTFDSRMRQQAIAALELENSLWLGLSAKQFRAWYKPLHRLADGKLLGLEALVRWEHPRKGLLAPADFLGTASEMGIGRDIDAQVWRQACLAANRWRQRFGRNLLLCLHFNMRHFLSPQPEQRLLDLLDELNCDPSRTIIELPEGSLHEGTEVAGPALLRLVDSGVRLHLANFGSGQHSLYSLQRFHVGAVKIDPHLVKKLDDPRSADLVQTICNMALSLHLDVIAQGVATERQRQLLISMGCRYGQGPLFAAAMDEEGVDQLLTTQELLYGADFLAAEG